MHSLPHQFRSNNLILIVALNQQKWRKKDQCFTKRHSCFLDLMRHMKKKWKNSCWKKEVRGGKYLIMFVNLELCCLKNVSFELLFLITATILKTTSRGIPDYGVVPIDGFPVDRTVNEIVTNAWVVRHTYSKKNNTTAERV